MSTTETQITTLHKHVTLGTRTEEGRSRPMTISAEIEYKDGRLSITGSESGGSSGQIEMHYTPELIAAIEPVEGWSTEMISRFFEVWRAWHLNDLRAGCEHQRANWQTDKKIEFVSYSIEWDTKRAIERVIEKETKKPGSVSVSKRFTDACVQDRLLTQTGVKPFRFSVVGPSDLARLSELFEIIDEHDRQGREAYNTRLENYQKAFQAVERGERLLVTKAPVRPLLLRRIEVKTAGWVRPSEHPDGLLMKPCHVCEYEYGSKWLREEVPGEVLEFLRELPSGTKPDPAGDFLRCNDLEFEAVLASSGCPPWCDGSHMHGDKYNIMIRRTGAKVGLELPFWNSLHAKQKREPVKPYDVLAAISSDAYTSDTFEEFCGEFGYDADSRKAHATFERVNALAKELRDFFSQTELEELAEIR